MSAKCCNKSKCNLCTNFKHFTDDSLRIFIPNDHLNSSLTNQINHSQKFNKNFFIEFFMSKLNGRKSLFAGSLFQSVFHHLMQCHLMTLLHYGFKGHFHICPRLLVIFEDNWYEYTYSYLYWSQSHRERGRSRNTGKQIWKKKCGQQDTSTAGGRRRRQHKRELACGLCSLGETRHK